MTDRTRKAVAFVVRSKSTIIVLGAIWAIGVAALVTVVSVQHRVDAQRHAEVVVGTLERQVGNLAEVAFTPAVAATGAGPTAMQTKLQIDGDEQAIRASLANLGALGGQREPTRLAALDRQYFAMVERLAALVVHGESRQAALLFGEAEQPLGSYGALNAELHQAGVTYGNNATRSRLIASIGTVASIAFMLLAFSAVFFRVTRLAAERHRLLERSREEALTDQLTGLANRRRLFADMELLLARERGVRDKLVLGMFDLDGFKVYNDTFGHPAGDALLARLGQQLRTAIAGKGVAYRMGGDEFCVIASGADAEETLEQAKAALTERSEIYTIGCSAGTVVVAPKETSLEHALAQADQRLYNSKRSDDSRAGGEGHDVLLRVLSESSPSLAAHLSSVGMLAVAVARKLGLSEPEVTLTRLTAELHDIGKTAIPDAILDKAGPLDADEWAFMRRHTVIGERILAAAPALAEVAPLVRATHERSDGAGYPDGLQESEIPFSSRIVAVVDAYDAMTSKRAYSPMRTPEQAIAELRRCSGSQFDPAVAEAFIAVWQEARDTSRHHATAPVTVAA